MGICVLAGKIQVNLSVVHARRITKIDLAEVLLETFSGRLFLCFNLACTGDLPITQMPLLLFERTRDPVGWRRADFFRLATDRGVRDVAQFRCQRTSACYSPDRIVAQSQ